MADASANTAVPGTTREEHTAPVIREIGELMLLERSLTTCKSNEERYHLLVTTVERELPWALEIEAPSAKGSVEYATWQKDMVAMEKVFQEFISMPAPAMPTPFAKPLRGGDTMYQYLLPGGRNLGTIEADHTSQVLPAILRPENEKAYHNAARPLRKWHVQIKRIYKRYHIWSEKTEIALRLSDYSDEYGQSKIDNAYIPPQAGEEDANVVSGTADDDDDDDDENLGFMDSR